MRRNDLSQGSSIVLRIVIPYRRLRVKSGGPCLAYIQALHHLLEEPRPEIPTPLALQLSRDPEEAYEVGHKDIRHC